MMFIPVSADDLKLYFRCLCHFLLYSTHSVPSKGSIVSPLLWACNLFIFSFLLGGYGRNSSKMDFCLW